jgi:hypothetical protein
MTFNGSDAFLRPVGGGRQDKDVFAYVDELPNGTISVGDKATFDLMPDPYKPVRMRAANVRLVDGEKKRTDNKRIKRGERWDVREAQG